MSLAKRLSEKLAPPPKEDFGESATGDFAMGDTPSVVGLVESVLFNRNVNWHFFRPSMLWGCDRQNIFHYTQAPFHPAKQSPKMLRILDNGTAVHEVVQGYLADHPDWFFSPEARVLVEFDGVLVRGSCDGVLVRRKDGYRMGVEIKTINHTEFAKLSAPKESHVLQASVYAALAELDRIVILYWDKDKQELKEFLVRVDVSARLRIGERVYELGEYLKSRTLPEFDKKTCDTTFCQYVEICRKEGAPV